MPEKPTTADGYSPAYAEMVRATCLYVATKLGDLTDDMVVVGGLVPSLIIDQALAFSLRGENKDAYDLFYVVRNFGSEPKEVANLLRPILEDPSTVEALSVLRRDFTAHDGIGPRRVAEFHTGGRNDALQADVVGYVASLLRAVDRE